jgi:hypothetical protein
MFLSHICTSRLAHSVVFSAGEALHAALQVIAEQRKNGEGFHPSPGSLWWLGQGLSRGEALNL